jgi:hypothetical protein
MQHGKIFYCDEEIKKAFSLLAMLPPKTRKTIVRQINDAAIAAGIKTEA